MNIINREKDILGAGWHFPMRISSRGGLLMSQYETDIEQSIELILKTAKGERRMRPEFGCSINDYVFDPNNATTSGLISRAVEEALGWWEPRIEVLDVDVSPDLKNESLLFVNIKYRVKATNDERSLVYPFYLSR